MTTALPEFFRHVDVHTHSARHIGPQAIVCVEPDEDGKALLAGAPDDAMFSVGVHPWNAGQCTDNTLEKLRAMAQDARVVALGECGLDARRGPAMDIQKPVFEAQAGIAEQLKLPLIIHAVGSWAEIIAARKRIKPQMPWIIHGFRGKPELAAQLTAHGMYLSLGSKFNKDILQIIDPRYILHETDSPSDDGDSQSQQSVTVKGL